MKNRIVAASRPQPLFDTLTRWFFDENPTPLAAQLADRVTAVLDGLAAGISPVS